MYTADRPLSARIRKAVRQPHRFLPVGSCLRTLGDQAELPIRLRQARADLYHSPYYAMALAPGVPHVVDVHDLIPVLYRHYWSPAAATLIKAWQARVARHAACVVTGSQSAADDVASIYGVGAERIVVTPWGVVDWDVEAAEPAGQLREPYLLCVCTNKPHKNLVRLIQAYTLASRSAPSFPDLLIAGGWSDRFAEPAEAAAVANAGPAPGSVRFSHNPADGELRYLYEHALGFVFPSLYEGFGLPVLEAMQAGLPIASSTTPAVAEVAAGSTLAFDPLDVAAMATAIGRLALDSDLRAHLRAASAARLQAFTWTRTAECTLKAYEVALCG
jgi:glycosyltransferase involved in cell wall biosynthesis